MSWLPPVVTVAPASEPVSSAEAKAQCRVDGTDEDAAIAIYIASAREFVEVYTGTKLESQTVVMRASCFDDLWHLPVAPLSSVTGITYLDTAGTEQTLSTDVYETVLIGLEPHIRLKVDQTWPAIRDATDAIRVTAVAGYASLPAPIKHAMLLMISSWFDSRSVGPVPDGAIALLTNYRRF